MPHISTKYKPPSGGKYSQSVTFTSALPQRKLLVLHMQYNENSDMKPGTYMYKTRREINQVGRKTLQNCKTHTHTGEKIQDVTYESCLKQTLE